MAIITNNSLSRDLGGLEARMKNTEARLERMERKIDDLCDAISTSKGSVKTMIALGGIAATLTGILSAMATWFFGKQH